MSQEGKKTLPDPERYRKGHLVFLKVVRKDEQKETSRNRSIKI